MPTNYQHPRGIDRAYLTSLGHGHWIERKWKQNLCITGPTGTGKTWLACALGNQACRQGHSVRYLRLPRFFEQLRIAHGDGSYGQLSKTGLLILDLCAANSYVEPAQKLRSIQRFL